MTGSTGTLYWRDTAGVTLIESDAAGTGQHGYAFFAGRMIARNDLSPSWSAHFYFSDHLGSSNVVTNATGTIEDESDFYPYGGEISVTNSVPQNYKFTGKERDTESGLDNFGARYYASGMGRFITPDWAARPTTVPYASFGDPQTLNLYTYVENGPVNRVDADGHDELYCGHDGSWCDGGESARQQQTDSDPVKKKQQQEKNDAATKAAQAQKQTYGRQKDGSYVAPPSKTDPIMNPNGPPPPLIGKGQCVTGTSELSGVTPRTADWTRGKPVMLPNGQVDPSIPKNTAVATFDENGHYPTNGNRNSGLFEGGSTKGSFWLLDQWPEQRDPHNNVIQEAKPEGLRPIGPNGANISNQSGAYFVIIVP